MKRKLSKFELYIIGQGALSTGLMAGYKFYNYCVESFDGYMLTIIFTIGAFFLFSFVAAMLIEIFMPIFIWFGKFITRTEVKEA